MTIIIGVDCSTDPYQVGLALAAYSDSGTTVLEARRGDTSLIDTIVDWIGDSDSDSVLLAFDSPLGWPSRFGASLHDHRAGEPILVDRSQLFRRMTDDAVAPLLGRPPLDVASNLIARTAHATVNRLEEIRHRTGLPIPLAWEPKISERVEAIEVYPAVTLNMLGLPTSKYKKAGQRGTRVEILAGLEAVVRIDRDHEAMCDNDDVLDAVVCAVAGADFLAGRAMVPADLDIARKEGWIWVREP